jgi:Protein of unknown function (DUF3485)
MPMTRAWVGLIVLAVVGLAGDQFCRLAASGVNQDEQLRVASEAISRLPESIGGWKMVKSEPLSDRVLEILHCRTHQNRTYVNHDTGDSVSFIMLVGIAGPMVAHTPEICYASSTFEVVEKARREVIRGTGDRADTFYRVLFQSKTLTGQKQQVYYAWRPPAGHWQAPKNPRLTLAGSPLLYKIQLATADASQTDASTKSEVKDASHPTTNANQRFLADLLPVLDTVLQNR